MCLRLGVIQRILIESISVDSLNLAEEWVSLAIEYEMQEENPTRLEPANAQDIELSHEALA